MKEKIVVYWARRDFRMRDNPALYHAVEKAKKESLPLFPLFILEDYMRNATPKFQWGYPQRAFLSRTVPAYLEQFEHGYILKGKGAETLTALTEHYDIEVFVNEDVYPDFYKQIKKLTRHGVTLHLYRDQLTVAKDTVSGKGTQYSIFTPFKKAVWGSFVSEKELPAPEFSSVSYIQSLPENLSMRSVSLSSDAFFSEHSSVRSVNIETTEYDIETYFPEPPDISLWYTTEAEALAHFDEYLKKHLDTYKKDRDSLELDLTSKMSLALTWGLVSARTLVARIKKHFKDDFLNPFSLRSSEGAIHYISELIWREFYKYLFYHTPTLMNTEFQERFRGTIEWEKERVSHERFLAWIQGRTGYDIVDAAMLQLARTGWMHNRARMIAASVLTKNLGVDWRWGQEYFRATLIDLDEASNNGGWQWGASVGADPKPIRIFNPYLQEKNYDTSGGYRKKWLSRELESIEPIVPHTDARAQALARYHLHETRDGTPRDY